MSSNAATKRAAIQLAPYAREVPGSAQFAAGTFWTVLLVTPAVLQLGLRLPLLAYPLVLALTLVPCYTAFMIIDSYMKNAVYGQRTAGAGLEPKHYFKATDPALVLSHRIPIETWFEAYFDGRIELRGDMLDVLENRHDWALFNFTAGHLKFFVNNLLPEALFHSKSQDETQVREHYDRGNDFYAAFLGPMMIYTSGIVTDLSRRESLEELQENKLKLVCEKIMLKPGENMLDIGCGWGTLLAYAAKNYGATVTGLTLAREQTEFGLQRAKEWGVADKVNIMCADYRDIPRPHEPNGTKYNKITCLEMAEHVGVRKFNRFLLQVRELLQDDGIFYLQIAGLRRAWQYEDLVWGIFMNKYVFPGADASMPLAWVVQQLEYAGFEVLSSDTIGVHYSATLERWYRNWIKPENKAPIVAKYGEKAWRVWEFFLAYSAIIARQGSATCYQLVCHKNLNAFDRTRFLKAEDKNESEWGYHLRRLVTNTPAVGGSVNIVNSE